MRIVTLVGWLKACELMKSPFGEDEDSFEIDWILRRNMDVGLDIVTREGARFPTLARDPHWERRTPGMDALRGKQARGRGGRASSYSGSTGRASDGMFPGPAGRAGGGGGRGEVQVLSSFRFVWPLESNRAAFVKILKRKII